VAGMDAAATPGGVVTFLVTDVVASTRLWRESPHAGAALARQAELIAAAVVRHGGVRPPDQGEGDSTLAAFARPADALAAALEAQRALGAEPWLDGAEVSVRMAVHTGDAQLRDGGNYGGLAIIRAARIRALAHGGQILVSSATAGLADDGLPDGASLVELGSVTLPGFARPERVHELSHGDLPAHAGRLGPLRASPTSSLGPWPTSLVGRERELRDLGELLEAHALVTITGAGGSGKTRLAHAIAETRTRHYSDGIVWVELTRVADPAQVAPAVVTACGLMETPGASALEVLTSRLAKAEVLVVLDNCEHLLGASAELAEAMVRAGPGVRVLATSREPLGAVGETMWRIPSLATAPEDERKLEQIAAYDAVKLFVERARASRPDFSLDDANAPLVSRICRRLDGIPLALELAAARLRALSLERLAEGLDDRFRLLTGGARTAVARQRTLLASVEWSHDLLEPAEKALFGRLAVFTAPFTLDAAEFVGAEGEIDRTEVFDLLARLVDKSLVQHGGDRYWLLETLRQYGLEHGDARELAAARDRHLQWFRRRSEAWHLDCELLTEGVADEIAAEKPDLLAALDWSLGAGRTPAVDLLVPLGAWWPWRGIYTEALVIPERVLTRFEPGSRAWLEVVAPVVGALLSAGHISVFPLVERALAAHGDSIAPGARSLLETGLASLATLMARPRASEFVERALESARAAGNRRAEVLTSFAQSTFLGLNDLRRARPVLAWLDRQVPPDAAIYRFVELNLGILARADCDYAAMRERLRRPPRHPQSVVFLGFLSLDTGDRAPLRAALALLGQLGELGAWVGARELTTGIAAILDGNLGAARERLGEASGMAVSARTARSILVGVHVLLGELKEARAVWTELQQHIAAWPRVPQLHLEVIHGHLLREERAATAESVAHAALAGAIEVDYAWLQLQALELLAALAADAGRLTEAGRLIGAADAFRARTGFVRALPLGRIDELRPRVGSAALEEGARLSLEEAVAYAQRGRGERGRPAHGWESLTPSEQRVVELVGEGLPNAEIATKLFVSVATVKTHLLHVYGKLGVRTRTELAARAARRDWDS